MTQYCAYAKLQFLSATLDEVLCARPEIHPGVPVKLLNHDASIRFERQGES